MLTLVNGVTSRPELCLRSGFSSVCAREVSALMKGMRRTLTHPEGLRPRERLSERPSRQGSAL